MPHHVEFSQAHVGHDVCDLSGDTIGKVINVHQVGRAMGGQQMPAEGYIECDCQLPGMSKPLYIPFNAFRQCDGDCCYLDIDKDDVSRKGWDRKPSNL